MEKKTEFYIYNGIYEDMVDYLGLETTVKIYERYKGQQVNFPVKLHSMEYIVEQLSKNNDSKYIKDIARKYGYTEQWLRRMIKKNSKTLSDKNQLKC